MLAAIVGGLFNLTRSEQPYASPLGFPLLLVPAYPLIADATGNAARAEAGAGWPALANPDIATAVATRFAPAFWLASTLSTAAGGAALVFTSDSPPQPGGVDGGSAASARAARPPRVRLLRLADYTSLAVLAGYLGGSGLALGRLAWQIAVELPTRDAVASLAPQAARVLPAVALALSLYGCARTGAAPTRGALQLLFAVAGAFHAGRAWVGRGPVGAAASAG
jgi:hypothetical protein